MKNYKKWQRVLVLIIDAVIFLVLILVLVFFILRSFVYELYEKFKYDIIFN